MLELAYRKKNNNNEIVIQIQFNGINTSEPEQLRCVGPLIGHVRSLSNI